MQLSVLISLALTGLVWTTFGRASGFGFVEFDDPVYVYRNPQITSGLTLHSAGWAFTHSHALNWHPLTSLSHMLDWQLYGGNAPGHHVTNIILHCTAAVLLFLSWGRLTDALWPSAFLAALFAVHPLRVESVAWISERKDVLSGVFFLLTLAAYASYVRNPPSWPRYLLVLVVFALGLLSKPMLVTVPFVLLLLDYWPLHRWKRFAAPKAKKPPSNKTSSNRVIIRLALEKVPFLALSAGSCIATLLARENSGCSVPNLPLSWRLENAVESYLAYVIDFVCPTGLAVFYPHPLDSISHWHVILSVVLLMATTAGAIMLRQRYPYLMVGWLWFLIMLAPVIGIVEAGLQARADRYTYLPEIGLGVMVAFGVSDLSHSWKWRRAVLAIFSMVALAALSLGSFIQTGYWRDSLALWTRALAVTRGNETAHNNLGVALSREGRLDEAMTHYEKALELSNGNQERYDMDAAFTHVNMGNALVQKGESADAILHYHQALTICPDYADAHYNLGTALSDFGDIDQAIAEYERALAIQPGNAEVETSLGNAYLQKRAERQAIEHYERALQFDGNYVMAASNLALVLATSSNRELRDGPRALELALKANNSTGRSDPLILTALAAAQSATGNSRAAVEAAQAAVEVAGQRGDPTLARRLRRNLERYEAAAGD